MSDDDLLDGLRAVGDADSEGAFGVDEAQAREKMRGYLLPKREQYAVKLLQSAVQAGAQRLHVRTSRNAICFAHDGKAPSLEQLASLQGFLLPTSRKKLHLQSLALAINSALSDARAAVNVTAWDEAATHVLHATPDAFRVDGDVEPSRRRVEVQWRRGVAVEVSRPAALRLRSAWPEAAQLRASARWAPISVRIDNVLASGATYGEDGDFQGMGPSWRYVTCVGTGLLPRLYRKGHHVIEARFMPVHVTDPVVVIRSGSPASFVMQGEWSSAEPLRRRELPQGPDAVMPLRCRAVLGFCADPAAPPDVQIVLHGALLGRLTHPGLVAGLVGIVAVDHLPTDISGLAIQADALKALGDEVRRNALRIVQVLRTFSGTSLPECLAHVLTGKAGTRLVVM